MSEEKKHRSIGSKVTSDRSGALPIAPPARGKNKFSQALRASSKRIGLTDRINNKYK